jgi:hypothetical protein
MKKLVSKDSYLKFMYKDLKARNPKENAEYILKVLYNSNVKGRSDYRDIY